MVKFIFPWTCSSMKTLLAACLLVIVVFVVRSKWVWSGRARCSPDVRKIGSILTQLYQLYFCLVTLATVGFL